MRVVGRLLALFGIGVVVSAVVVAVAAHRMKRDFVAVDDPESDEIKLAAIFEPMSFKSTASSFRGGQVDCRFGGGVIDLREATVDPAGAFLKVTAMFGGGQILVPESWRVTTRVLGVGGAGDARPRIERAEDAPHLTIEGTAMFGGFGIASEMPEAAVQGLEEAVAKAAARHEHKSAEEPEVVAAV